MLFDTAGTPIANHTVEYPLHQPLNGWAEQDPHDWWRAVQETIQAVLNKSGVDPAEIRGVGISGEFATEVSDASGMNLLDVPKRAWSSEILSALDIDSALLARIWPLAVVAEEAPSGGRCWPMYTVAR